MVALEIALMVVVLLGALPLVVGAYLFVLAALHRFVWHAPPIEDSSYPRVAVIVPAWNEAPVLERTIDHLVALDYPDDRLRVYVVDDASTDGTPELMRRTCAEHPGVVFHLRRETGGSGKAHTINHGLRTITADDWYEAVLVIDADVLFTKDALWHMTAHLADPEIGAVTAYIKEGSEPDNYVTRFIAFEYVTAQAAARRSQNVLHVQACLAGGSQLIRRSSLEAIGGELDTTTLAEDTVTTFKLQLDGRRVVFEPYGVVWAEEPGTLDALWRQRLRWGRGNVQVTRRFRRVWFRPQRSRLGGVSFGLIWYSVTLMPAFIAASCFALVVLFMIDHDLSSHVFSWFWSINLTAYLFITLSSFSIDPQTARRAWREGLFFPGAISLLLMLLVGDREFQDNVIGRNVIAHHTAAALALYLWPLAAMGAAYLVKLSEHVRFVRVLTPLGLYLVGYGPLLCAMTVAAWVKELRHAEIRWEKTEKTGRIGAVT